eukprot:Em0009g126a
MSAPLKKVYIFISEGEGITKAKASNLYVVTWTLGVVSGSKGSTISKTGYSKKTSLDQFTVVLDIYSVNTLYPFRPPHDPTVQTHQAYYTEYGHKTVLNLVNKYDTVVLKDYLYMDHVLLISSHHVGKAREKKSSVQGALTVSYIVVDKHRTTSEMKPRSSSVIIQQRPLPSVPPSQAAPPCLPPRRASLPLPPNSTAVEVSSLCSQQEQSDTYEACEPSQENLDYQFHDTLQEDVSYEPYDPSQMEDGEDGIYSSVGQVDHQMSQSQGEHTAMTPASYETAIATGSPDEESCDRSYEYVALSRKSSEALMPKRKASITFMVTDWQQMGARAGVPHEPVSLYPKSLAVVAPASAADHNRVTCVPKPGRWSRLGYPGSLGKSAG